MDINRVVQIAMLGEVPPTLRFLYVALDGKQLNFHATFSDDASLDHIASASCISTEILAACPLGTELNETIERDSRRKWKIGSGENLMYLRYGELSGT